MKLLQVKEYNREGYRQYKRALDSWSFEKGGFPFRPMFLYTDEYTGKEKKNGWVLMDGTNSTLFPNRVKALEFARINNIK